jgi:hypothetical protein
MRSDRSFGAGIALTRGALGWRSSASRCAVALPGQASDAPAAAGDAVTYAFVGVAIDGTLVSADADVAPLLGAPPATHDVRLVALALTDRPTHAWAAGPALVQKATDDSCACDGATHFAGDSRAGGALAFAFTAPRLGEHARAIDLVAAALGDPERAVREVNEGLAIDGVEGVLAGDGRPLGFHVAAPRAIATDAEPLDDLCTFATPEVTPSPVDFGVAPYGTPATRVVHVANRSALDLEALVGARTVALPARAAIDLPLAWTPDGDAVRCETQTRDESILFLPAGRDHGRDAAAPSGRRARVLETVRTGKPRVERAERVEVPGRAAREEDKKPREWSCPPDYEVTACRAENRVCADGRGCTSGGYGVVAEPRGRDGCRFACRGPQGSAGLCRFDAVMECALACP